MRLPTPAVMWAALTSRARISRSSWESSRGESAEPRASRQDAAHRGQSAAPRRTDERPGRRDVAIELEEGLENFGGCAVVISHDRWFLDRLATHILAFEGDSHVEWFEGNFQAYEEDKLRRLGAAALDTPKAKFARFARG